MSARYNKGEPADNHAEARAKDCHDEAEQSGGQRVGSIEPDAVSIFQQRSDRGTGGGKIKGGTLGSPAAGFPTKEKAIVAMQGLAL